MSFIKNRQFINITMLILLSVFVSHCSSQSAQLTSDAITESQSDTQTESDAIDTNFTDPTQSSPTGNSSNGTDTSEDINQQDTEVSGNNTGDSGNTDDSGDSTPQAQAIYPVRVEAGRANACALLSDGSIKCWGPGYLGQIGNGQDIDKLNPTQVNGIGASDPAIDLSVSYDFACAVLQSHKVMCWGNNEHGQLGDGSQTNSNTPKEVAGLNSESVYAVQVSTGTGHSCARMNNGSLKCWGWNRLNQLGQDTADEDVLSPIDVTNIDGVTLSSTEVEAGGNTTCAVVDNGKVYCWGSGTSGQAGPSVTIDTATPSDVTVFDGSSIKAKALSGDTSSFCATTEDKKGYCWGSNYNNSLGNSTAGTTSNIPLLVDDIDGTTHSTIEMSNAGSGTICSLLTTGEILCWGANLGGQAGDGNPAYSTAGKVYVSGISNATQVTGGTGFSCALLDDKTIKCWGDNASGQLGNGTAYTNPTPTKIEGIAAKAISAGSNHTCVVTTDDEVKCWGDNSSYQLGIQTETYSKTPLTVPGLETSVDINRITSGLYHNCVLLDDSRVQCWGGNSDGQLGNNSTSTDGNPVFAIGLDNTNPVVKIQSDMASNCAVLTDQTVKCWGTNNYGQMGDGSTDDVLQPTPVSLLGPGTASNIGLGSYHTCIQLTDGTVQCQGFNSSGQLGDGTKTQSLVPVAVNDIGSTLSTSARLDGGYGHTCAVLADESIACWGQNISHQLGYEWRGQYMSPVETFGFGPSDSKAKQIYTGQNHSCAVTKDGQIKCWGQNTYGQLGTGNRGGLIYISEAIESIPDVTQNTKLAIAENHVCAMNEDGSVYCWGSNSNGQIGSSAAVKSDSYTPTTVQF